jgi:hypothetical protein
MFYKNKDFFFHPLDNYQLLRKILVSDVRVCSLVGLLNGVGRPRQLLVMKLGNVMFRFYGARYVNVTKNVPGNICSCNRVISRL